MTGELYTLPVEQDDGPTIPGKQVPIASSLAGARRGEYCPVDPAEIAVPSAQTELLTRWGKFQRVKVLHQPNGYRHEPKIIEAWLRV